MGLLRPPRSELQQVQSGQLKVACEARRHCCLGAGLVLIVWSRHSILISGLERGPFWDC